MLLSDRTVNHTKASHHEIISAVGQKTHTLLLLHEGEVFICLRDKDNKLRRLYTLQAPSTLGSMFLNKDQVYQYYIIANHTPVLSSFETTLSNLPLMLGQQANIGVIYLKSIYKETTMMYKKVLQLYNVYSCIVKYLNALSLAYSKITPLIYSQFIEGKLVDDLDPIQLNACKLLEKYLENHHLLPVKLTLDFFKEDYIPIRDIQINTNSSDLRVLKEIQKNLTIPTNQLATILQQDCTIITKWSTQLIPAFYGNLQQVQLIMDKIDLKLQDLLDHKTGWLARFVKDIEQIDNDLGRDNVIARENAVCIAKFMYSFINMLEKEMHELWDISLKKHITRDAWEALRCFINTHEEEVKKKKVGADKQDVDTVTEEKALHFFNNFTKRIFEYSELPLEECEKYNIHINQLKELDNFSDRGEKSTYARKAVNHVFWKLYEIVAVKHYSQQNQNLTRDLYLFLNYGLLDTDIIEVKDLVYLYNLDIQPSSNVNGHIPIYSGTEWLQAIYNGEVDTSINELGLTLFEILKQQHQNRTWKKATDIPPDILNPVEKLRYEIKNIVASSSRLVAESPLNYIAILNKHTLRSTIEETLVTKQALSEQLDKLLTIDFSCFHREILHEFEETAIGREFIQIKVIPNFIFMPSCGTRIRCWQEREGKHKRSPGRMTIPHISNGDLFKMLIEGIGIYRWEMLKTTLGLDWNNITKSSLTADYINYIQFFKKNKELSNDAKEKVAREFLRCRDDKSRFVNDYEKWILYESAGVSRMNKVVRWVFIKHVPFPKGIRDKLVKLPMYAELVRKSTNRHRRKAMEYEPRLRKYAKHCPNVPQELSDTYNFYNMENSIET